MLSDGKCESNKLALSSCETGYQGLEAATQEKLFRRQLLCNLQHPQQQPISLGEDNQSAIKL